MKTHRVLSLALAAALVSACQAADVTAPSALAPAGGARFDTQTTTTTQSSTSTTDPEPCQEPTTGTSGGTGTGTTGTGGEDTTCRGVNMMGSGN